MNDLDIINYFKAGKSITFITNQFYRELIEKNYKNCFYIKISKEINKNVCRKIVENVIIKYLKRENKTNGQS